MNRIGVLTSGGDAPGMNAAVRAIVAAAHSYQVETIGIDKGYNGLIEGRLVKMDLQSVSDIIDLGGTILKTNRCEEFKTKAGQEKALRVIQSNQLDGIIVIGGDGSFMGAKILSEYGIPTVGIPGTIDNDLAYTEYTIGFDTALNTVIGALDKIRDTMESHDRVGVVEVMGRLCGDIALYAGLALGAQAVVIPEIPTTIEQVCERLLRSRANGNNSSLVVLAEGAGKAEQWSLEIQSRTGIESRPTLLGYMQRGGSPSAFDRKLAVCMGVHAVKLVAQGIGNRVVGFVGNRIIDQDIVQALSMPKRVPQELYDIVQLFEI